MAGTKELDKTIFINKYQYSYVNIESYQETLEVSSFCEVLTQHMSAWCEVIQHSFMIHVYVSVRLTISELLSVE